MKIINVNLGKDSHSIIIDRSFDNLPSYINGNHRKCMVITDENVEKFYLTDLCSLLNVCFKKTITYSMKPGENSKNMEQIHAIYSHLLKNDFNRYDYIISLGGGVIGDTAGFAAATFMRGINLIHIPTSLLAQNDSSIGGKTGVNFLKAKNIVGAFYQPKLVYINYGVLKTLPDIELKNGLIEILVHAIIKDSNLLSYIENNLEDIMKLKPDILENLIYWNCSIKTRVIISDVYDKGDRAILNFGHTIGHAIESAYDYKYKHGECVALGIIGACYISEQLGKINHEITLRICNMIRRIGIMVDIQDFDQEKVMSFLLLDKKRSTDGISFILPIDIGNVIKYEIDNVNIIANALNFLQNNAKIFF